MAGSFRNENDRDANSTAKLLHTRDENLGISGCELSDLVERLDEAFLVIGIGVWDLLGRSAHPGEARRLLAMGFVSKAVDL